MDTSAEYTEKLEYGLEKKASQLEKKELPLLKEQFKIYQAAFQGLYNLLLKKGIIHEDPYKYENKLSEVTIPSESPFIENERIDQMSIRCSSFESQLDFLVDFYQFSIDFLNMARIKRLMALIKYFNFVQFTETSQILNTRTLAEMLGTIKKGGDQLAAGVVNDALLHLDKASKEIVRILKNLTLYHKEIYKLQIRKTILPGLEFEREFAVTHHEDCVKKIKHKCVEHGMDKVFYPELVEEILREDYSQDAEVLRSTILKDLEVKEELKSNIKAEQSFKTTLLEGIRILASINFQLEDITQKLIENAETLQSEKNSLWDQIKNALASLFGRSNTHVIYEVEFTDTITGIQKTEKFNFTIFIAEFQKKVKTYQQLNNRASPAFKRLEAASENQVFSFLEKSIEDLQSTHKKLAALDNYFKNAVATENKTKIRGSQMELSLIKTTIIKANQRKHEYISQKEEQEQMAKLGIKSDII